MSKRKSTASESSSGSGAKRTLTMQRETVQSLVQSLVQDLGQDFGQGLVKTESDDPMARIAKMSEEFRQTLPGKKYTFRLTIKDSVRRQLKQIERLTPEDYNGPFGYSAAENLIMRRPIPYVADIVENQVFNKILIAAAAASAFQAPVVVASAFQAPAAAASAAK